MNEERYCLTPWGCMSFVLTEYGIDISHITPKMGEHMVDDFMNSMIRAGHVSKSEEKDDV